MFLRSKTNRKRLLLIFFGRRTLFQFPYATAKAMKVYANNIILIVLLKSVMKDQIEEMASADWRSKKQPWFRCSRTLLDVKFQNDMLTNKDSSNYNTIIGYTSIFT